MGEDVTGQADDPELELIRQALREFYGEEDAELWLSTPHQLLGGDRPLALIQKGRYEEVKAVIDQLRSGAYV